MSEIANISEKQDNANEKIIGNEPESIVADANNSVSEKSLKPPEDLSPISEKKTPVKRTPSKRMSFIERAQKESEELVRTMGGNLELEGGRRTRSSSRGTPTQITPPPNKRQKSSPASAKTPGRGRGRKLNIAVEPNEEEKQEKSNTTTTKDEVDKASVPTVTDGETIHEDEAKTNVEKSEGLNKQAEDAEKPVVETVKETVDNSADVELNSVEENITSTNHESENANVKDDVVDVKSTMETDESTDDNVTDVPIKDVDVAVIQTAVEKLVPVKDVVVEKEPTPEPMEVDGDSNLIEEQTIVPSTEEVVAVVEPQTNTTETETKTEITVVPAENSVEKEEKKNTLTAAAENTEVVPEEIATVNSENSASTDVTPAAVPQIIESTIDNTVNDNENQTEVKDDNSVDATTVVAKEAEVIENDVSSTINDKVKSVDYTAKVEPTVLTAKEQNDNTDFNKSAQIVTEDNCEPKVVSPTVIEGTDEVSSTPQLCN